MTRNHLLSASVLLMMSVFGAASAHAQTEGWLRGPGSATGKDSKIEADCIKAEDGSVTCAPRWSTQPATPRLAPITTPSTTEARE